MSASVAAADSFIINLAIIVSLLSRFVQPNDSRSEPFDPHSSWKSGFRRGRPSFGAPAGFARVPDANSPPSHFQTHKPISLNIDLASRFKG
jgi:hypothetical protein